MSLLPFGRRFAQLGPHTVYHAHTCIVPYPLLFQFHPFNLESGRLFAEDSVLKGVFMRELQLRQNMIASMRLRRTCPRVC